MQTVLAKIVADKAIWVETRKEQQPLASFQNEVQPSTRHFYDALQGARTAFILECKKASPSKGVIRDDFDPARIAAIYKHYASAISVLTDEKYFQGSFDFLPIVSQIAPQPILCKDFIIDPYQIYLARIKLTRCSVRLYWRSGWVKLKLLPKPVPVSMAWRRPLPAPCSA